MREEMRTFIPELTFCAQADSASEFVRCAIACLTGAGLPGLPRRVMPQHLGKPPRAMAFASSSMPAFVMRPLLPPRQRRGH